VAVKFTISTASDDQIYWFKDGVELGDEQSGEVELLLLVAHPHKPESRAEIKVPIKVGFGGFSKGFDWEFELEVPEGSRLLDTRPRCFKCGTTEDLKVVGSTESMGLACQDCIDEATP
jgi:hypothetical protein